METNKNNHNTDEADYYDMKAYIADAFAAAAFAFLRMIIRNQSSVIII